MLIRTLPRWCLRLVLAGFVAASLSARVRADEGAVTIAHVFTGWRDAASFKRISEYFSGRENTGGQIVLRTQPDQRSGFYFLVRVANPGASRPVRFNLQLITAAAAKPAAYDFSAELKPGTSVLNLGLTGTDWPNPKANPVAWKLDVTSADGRVLATEKSYLWEKPAGK